MNHEPLRIHYVTIPSELSYPEGPLATACDEVGISVRRAKEKYGDRSYDFPRFHVMAKMRKRGLSYPRIAALMNRTHGAIMSGVRRWEAQQ